VGRKFSEEEEELVSLWRQSWTAINVSLTTVGPLFLILILLSYVFSQITQSQTVASVGLVYIFVFLLVVGSYFLATVPFIVLANAINALVNPTSDSAQKDFARLALLLTVVAGAVLTFQHYKN
jgi:hypothetical protein